MYVWGKMFFGIFFNKKVKNPISTTMKELAAMARRDTAENERQNLRFI
jgi:hypothetical protein